MAQREPKPSEPYAAVLSTGGGYYVIVAEFPDTTQAKRAYGELQVLERNTTLRIDGVAVAHRGADGKVVLEKVTDHSTRSGLKWGVVGGIVIGALFPPTILAGALGTGALGAVIGKIRNQSHRSGLAKELDEAMAPGTSAIVALVEDKAVVEVEQALASANRIVSKAVDRATAMQIDAEAQAAKTAAGVQAP